MNNFRFVNGGKRKFLSIAKYTSASESRGWVFERSNNAPDPDTLIVRAVLEDTFKGLAATDNQKYALVEGAQFRITHLEFENLVDSAVEISYPNAFQVLGRPVQVLASNNSGVDGSYKIPEDHILRRWSAVAGPNVSVVQDCKLIQTLPDTQDFRVYIYGEYVS